MSKGNIQLFVFLLIFFLGVWYGVLWGSLWMYVPLVLAGIVVGLAIDYRENIMRIVSGVLALLVTTVSIMIYILAGASFVDGSPWSGVGYVVAATGYLVAACIWANIALDYKLSHKIGLFRES